jgi:hypothetical protein
MWPLASHPSACDSSMAARVRMRSGSYPVTLSPWRRRFRKPLAHHHVSTREEPIRNAAPCHERHKHTGRKCPPGCRLSPRRRTDRDDYSLTCGDGFPRGVRTARREMAGARRREAAGRKAPGWLGRMHCIRSIVASTLRIVPFPCPGTLGEYRDCRACRGKSIPPAELPVRTGTPARCVSTTEQDEVPHRVAGGWRCVSIAGGTGVSVGWGHGKSGVRCTGRMRHARCESRGRPGMCQ